MHRLLAVLLLILTGCSPSIKPIEKIDAAPPTTAPETREHPDGTVEERRVGIIASYGDPVRVELPASVLAGEAVEVTVVTYGDGCTRKGDTEVEISDLSAEVTPYDWEVTQLPPDTACTLELRLYEHTATLRFDRAGTAQVIIRGREEPSGEVIAVEYPVAVH